MLCLSVATKLYQVLTKTLVIKSKTLASPFRTDTYKAARIELSSYQEFLETWKSALTSIRSHILEVDRCFGQYNLSSDVC
ncbi:hypothetical protein COCVIDRAFT_85620 [Bipolaris victoriae FI3]|uniref:Uncharacterized protein n=1 Tax=Bipolaris victoriae (strain FI3) TaxID=930091 RepID=W7EVZ6_BIPV3|nr:hypothetical protein COCVIDRAFT_85620 [Bipolaris victoriae FI3]